MSKLFSHLSPEQRRNEIVRIFSQGLRRLANASPNLPKILTNGEKTEESSLTSLDVSPESRLHVCNDNAL
jgi:hypothetical protein